MKVAIVHDYLFQFGGAEKVVEVWLEMYPEADIYTSFLVHEKFTNSPTITSAYQSNRIHTSIAQYIFRFRFLQRFQKHFFWLYPIAMRLVRVKNYDLVLISSTDCGKQIQLYNNQKIVHYCHSPTRYLHGLITEADHQSLNLVYRFLIPLFIPILKYLDLNAVYKLNDHHAIWLANSSFIKQTIKEVYDTESTVIYPPIDLDTFLRIKRERIEDFYLCHGRISFHKRLDLAILSCLQLKRSLKISGVAGFEKQMDDLKYIVSEYETQYPDTQGLIQFLGRTTDEEYAGLVSHCRGFLFPGKEDFGIAPIEILASGVPIIAYQAGGALEYITEGVNGVFFPEQTVGSLMNAILKFEDVGEWNTQMIRDSSKPFGKDTFITNMLGVIEL
jgi:glycosyltransferase involved in cell wall biosynthesis